MSRYIHEPRYTRVSRSRCAASKFSTLERGSSGSRDMHAFRYTTLAALVVSLLVTLFLVLWLGNKFKLDIVIAANELSLHTTAAIFSIAAILSALLSSFLRRAWKDIVGNVRGILDVLDRHRAATIAISAIASTMAVYGVHTLSSDYLERYRYLNIMYRTVSALQSEIAKLPDPAELGTAFALYPGRKEVPVLLIRTSRVFAYDDNWSSFIEYQNRFVTQIWNLMTKDDMCRSQSIHHDPVVFVAVVTVEAGVVLKEGEMTRDERFMKAARKSLDLLDSCPKTVERRILALRIRNAICTLDENCGFNIEELRVQIRDDIGALAPEERASLLRTHAYQEFLDSEAYMNMKYIRMVASSKRWWLSEGKAQFSERVERIIGNYKAILSLRSVLGSDGEIYWYTGPGKLNLYRLFMEMSGPGNSINRSFVSKMGSVVALRDRVTELMRSPAFEKYMTREEWYRATPLDVSLEGAQLETSFHRWMKTGW